MSLALITRGVAKYGLREPCLHNVLVVHIKNFGTLTMLSGFFVIKYHF